MNNPFKIIIAVFCIFSVSFLSAQSPERKILKNNTFHFQYYENELGERIMDGFFKKYDKQEYILSGLQKKEEITEIEGSYKNDKKDGKWVLNKRISIFDLSKVNGKIVRKLSKETVFIDKVFYSDGELKGKVERTQNGKVYEYWTYDDKSLLEGEAYISMCKGNFKKGMFDGEWSVSYKDNGSIFEEKQYFLNGVFYKFIKRNITNGTVEKIVDSSLFVKTFFENYIDSINISVVKGVPYSLGKEFVTEPDRITSEDYRLSPLGESEHWKMNAGETFDITYYILKKCSKYNLIENQIEVSIQDRVVSKKDVHLPFCRIILSEKLISYVDLPTESSGISKYIPRQKKSYTKEEIISSLPETVKGQYNSSLYKLEDYERIYNQNVQELLIADNFNTQALKMLNYLQNNGFKFSFLECYGNRKEDECQKDKYEKIKTNIALCLECSKLIKKLNHQEFSRLNPHKAKNYKY